jgi:hypothetical protein
MRIACLRLEMETFGVTAGDARSLRSVAFALGSETAATTRQALHRLLSCSFIDSNPPCS